VSDFDTNADDDNDGGVQLVEPIDDKSEFENTELEELVLKEGPQQIL
jgi:hypothetical protein